MDLETAKLLLKEAEVDEDDGDGDREPIYLPSGFLDKLTRDDLPVGVRVGVGVQKDRTIQVDWGGNLFKTQSGEICGEAEYFYTRKYWYEPIGLEQYIDLVRRAVETRKKIHGDVEITHYDDDGAYIQLYFTITTKETNIGKAFKSIQKICEELEEVSQRVSSEINHRITELAARVSGWGQTSLEELVSAVEKSESTDEKGRSLEELSSRLFETVNGFSITGRIKTETEEIDISILNDCQEPRLRREGALILAECKNWTGRCGKNEFVIFQQKLENRSRRCSLGFLISWNGFASTVTKEMLRGSREEILIVPITGKDLRNAVRENDFTKILMECWDNAVTL